MSTSQSKQSITGTVIKVCSENTIRIATKVTKVHPLYHKRYSKTHRYVAHDPKNEAKVGDVITIVSCRPISKNKHWIVSGN